MMAFGSVYGPPFVREGAVRRDATMDDFQNFTKLAQSFPIMDSAGGVICEPNDTPLDSRHLDMTYALATLTDKVFMGNVVSGPNAKDTIELTSILLGGGSGPGGRPGQHGADSRTDLADQLQLPAALGRPDARLALRVRRGQPGRRTHAVHPDGRDVAGDHPGGPGPADRRGPHRHRPRAADPPGLPGRVRLVPVQHRHAVRLADLRHPGVGHRPALHRPDRPPLRAAVPVRRHAHLLAGSRRAGGLRGADDADADVPGRRQLGDALGRLARGRPGRGLREVHRRHRAAADDARGVHAAGDRRGVAGLRSTRGGRLGRPLPRRGTHDGAVPHLLLPSPAVVLGELRAVVAQRWQRRGRPGLEDLPGQARRPTSSRRSTRRSAPRWRSSSYAVARSWATDGARDPAGATPPTPACPPATSC